VQLLGPALVVGAADDQRTIVVAPNRDRLGHHVLELTLRALDHDVLTVDLDIDPGRNRDQLSSNA
jgi:hypothetical protein